jgi:putative ABC transport system permease protein
MRALDKARLRIRSLFWRRKVDSELEDEFRFHLDQLVEENIAAGVEPREARKLALRKMGGINQFEEECRDMRRVNFVDDLLRDLRYAGRNLRHSPGFATLAVLIMALGIGADTAVFSVVKTVLLKPLSYRDPDRIVTLTNPLTTGEALTALSTMLVSIPNFQDWHGQSTSFDAMAYYQSFEAAVTIGAEAEYAQATKVSPEFFRVFAIEPVIGRSFTPEELKPGGGGGLMISYAYWQSHFGGDTHVPGRTVGGLGGPLPIVGVLPPGFRFPDKTDLWYPVNTISRERAATFRGAQNYFAVGRLKSGLSLQQVQAEMTSIAEGLAQQYPETNKNQTVAVRRMRDDMVGDVRLTLYLLLGAVSVVLLIACANTATLLLGKATARTREIAVRVAMGASRPRIVRQLIAESLLLALLAGASGLLLAYGGSKALVALAPANLPRLTETGIDRSVLAFTLGISMITSLLFGLVPAIYAAKVGLNEALKQGATRSVTGGGMVRTRGVLVTGEIALAVVLLSAAGLLLRSFVALHNVALGFRPENVLVMKATLPAPLPAVRQFFRDVVPQIAILPGVAAAGATNVLPGHVQSTVPFFFDYLPPQRDWISAPSAAISIVAPGTFRALGIPLKSGRDFNDNDTADKPFVAIVNEALVRKSLPGENPIGRLVFCPYDSSLAMTIIGVAGDVRDRGPAHDPMPACYINYQQHDFGGSLNIVARTVNDPTALESTLRRLVRDRSPSVSMKFTTMESDASENVATPRFRTLLFGVFAALAMSLAMAGVYGAMAYAVGQRSNEIGLRIALGASHGSLLRLILRESLAFVCVGLTVGLAAAVAVTRLLETMLFQVKPNDPLVYIGVAVLLGVVTLFAGYFPAMRAASIDPLTALRQE